MNERIKELAKEAGFVLWSDEEWKPEGAVIDWSSDYDNELAKFAELIVQECADWIDSNVGMIDEEEIVLEDLKKMLENHDWYFHMSDSGHYYSKGREERKQIEAEIQRLTVEGFRAEACALYNEIKPDDFFDKV